MKKFLIRTGVLPNESFKATEYFNQNLIGGNVGNLLYTYGIIRNITTDRSFEYHSNRYKLKDLDPNVINEEYSAFIIPLADAFRKDFCRELDQLTALVKQLKIPCYVIGVGLRDAYEPTFADNDFEFDSNVKNFVSAVLEKSASIGVGGQITADYLSKLGFKEGKDVVPIGCPSMYTYGPTMKVKTPTITKDSHISINTSLSAKKKMKDFLERCIADYKNFTFVPQTLKEMRYLYTGDDLINTKKSNAFYNDYSFFKDDRVKFFFSIPAWFNFFKDVDLSFGSRLHGNVAALLNNTPCIFFPKDARERELNDFHHFNSFPEHTLNSKTKIEDLIEKSDFSVFEKYQEANYKNFLSFLDMNGIAHIEQFERKEVPYDSYMKRTKFKKPVENYQSLSNTRKKIRKLYYKHQVS